METLESIIEEYVKDYGDDFNYSFIADRIIEDYDVGISHRTLRRKISEYINGIEDLQSEVIVNTVKDTPILNSVSKSSVKEFTGHIKGEAKVYIVSGCIHFPFHNKEAWEGLLGVADYLSSNKKLTGIVLAGDIVDNHSISRHAKGKITIPGLTLEEEYRLANAELDKLDDVIGDVEKAYFYGNHEMWYYDFMGDVNNHKLGKGIVKSPSEGLRLVNRGYNVQEDYRTASLMLGDCEVHHGVFVNKHAANEHAQRMKRTNAFFHTHRLGRYDEENIESVNGGWLGNKDAKVFGYCTRWQKETWKNGFLIINVDEDGAPHIEQLTWKNDRFIYHGLQFKG